VPAALAGALVVALTLSGCSGLTLPTSSGIFEPSIVPSTTQTGSLLVQRDFDFEDVRVKLRVPVDQAVYAGARSAEKSTVFIGKSQRADWVGGHYRSFVDEKHQGPFFEALLGALHAVRQERTLDSSRYVELVTSMAQTMEYRVDPASLAAKFPIETFSDGYGDCDDKTLLAAAVLARDGYDVAILFFEPEKHVALGIRAPGLEYPGTGYAYAEMTGASLVGIVPAKLAGGITLKSKPVVIRIGSGKLSYDAGGQVGYIRDRLAQIRTSAGQMGEQVTAENAKLDALRAALQSAKQDVESASGPASANAAIDRYNRMAKEHNALVASLNALIARHNALVEAERYAAEHQTARPQVYARLRALSL